RWVFIMARRNDHSRGELKEMIIQAAQELVVQHGYDELSARKISGKINYTVGTLYNVFYNLDDIILHVNALTLDKIYDYLNNESDITSLAKGYLSFSRQYYNEWNMLFQHHLPQDQEIPEWYQERIDKPFLLCIEFLKRSAPMSEAELVMHSRIIWSSVHGICALYHANKLRAIKEDDPEEMVSRFITTYLNGLK
ncbi:MAG: TetR/AcrR family transcriptional regulator, partial [Rickettsiales bacterium]|nr:TetR/AcrR family transcriptional regulator [Rickettsiales bacterium]